MGGPLVNDLPVAEVIIIENLLLPSNQEAMVPINDVRIEGSCLSLADNLLGFTESNALLKFIVNKRTALQSLLSRSLYIWC